MKNADPEKLVQFCLQLLKYSKIQTPNSHSVLLKLFLFVYQKKKKKKCSLAFKTGCLGEYILGFFEAGTQNTVISM